MYATLFRPTLRYCQTLLRHLLLYYDIKREISQIPCRNHYVHITYGITCYITLKMPLTIDLAEEVKNIVIWKFHHR